MSTPVSLERQVAAVRREIGQRRRLYPRWVAQEKMTQTEADRQIEAMEAVQVTLQNLLDAERAAAKPADLFAVDANLDDDAVDRLVAFVPIYSDDEQRDYRRRIFRAGMAVVPRLKA